MAATTTIQKSKIAVERDATIAAPTGSSSSKGSGRPSVMSDGEIAILSDGHQHCLVCYGDLTFRGKIPCGHNDICGICHLRMRFLLDDKKCPICKQTNDTVIVDQDHDSKKLFADYPRWGNDIGAGFVFRSHEGIFFEKNFFEKDIIPLFSYTCNKCDFKVDETTQNISKKNSSLRLLEDHLRSEHRLAMCRLCIDHKRDFVARLPRWTSGQLQHHLRKGDGPDSGFTGHPLCVFCRPKRFYDLNYLHQHLQKEHYKCHVCEKQGRDDQWFKNYHSLEIHFDKEHFLCHDVQCLGARFIVFENELDLRAHELSIHGGTSSGSTKINLEFRTRRAGYDGSGREDRQAAPDDSDFNYDLDGQAFVPEALPRQGSNIATTTNNYANHNSNAQLHPLHVQRTEELRAHAAAVRQQQALESQVEAFPTLQISAAPSASVAPLIGWTTGTALQKVNRNSGSVGGVTTEAFPALPSSEAAAANAKRAAIRGNVALSRRQLPSMSTAASLPRQTNNWRNTAPVAAPPGHSNPSSAPASFNRQSNLAPDNFPSLGPSSTPYAAAGTSARRNHHQHSPATNNASELFPLTRKGSANNLKPAPAQAPSLNNAVDFPAISATKNAKQSSVRHRMMGGSKPPPRMDNVLNVDVIAKSAANATVEDMKATLGPKNYKQLKHFTREFAQGDLSPEGYVDQSAALFDKGYADTDFWSYLPTLLESCPNQEASQHAMRYMASLRQQVYSEDARPNRVTNDAPVLVSNWNEASTNSNILRAPVPSTSSAPRPVVNQSRVPQPILIASNRKAAWGAGGAPTALRAKAPIASVAAAVASQGPQSGSATKFMAREQKKQTNAATIALGKSGGKKKKQNNELKTLAFGR